MRSDNFSRAKVERIGLKKRVAGMDDFKILDSQLNGVCKVSYFINMRLIPVLKNGFD